ncbi:MAG: zinc ABC transporter substrate-binding protein [Planctomycetes bacterium]|nr:zinc ABC transporter substrate-binding protein [Planctomycetota bacterium]NOG53041.1 zinc ABC transporter substrate-binding protein [Planctomycetota bacterium]
MQYPIAFSGRRMSRIHVTQCVLILGLVCALFPGCSREEPVDTAVPQAADQAQRTTEGEPTGDRVFTVYTTFYPMTYLTERIGGAHIRVVCPLPADEDAIFWQPPREVITKYQQADLIVTNGAEFEKWVGLASLPLSRVVSTADGFRDRWVSFEATVHSHGATGEHAHEGVDGHTWVDPISAAVQSQAIAIALKRALPDASADIDANLKAVGDDLMALDERLTGITPAIAEALILCSHPAYNYVAARYDLDVHNLALDPETVPTEEEWAHVKSVIDEAGGSRTMTVMLWEAEPLESVSSRLAADLGVVSVVFDPCEQPSDAESGDYMTRMNANIDRLTAVLQGGGG